MSLFIKEDKPNNPLRYHRIFSPSFSVKLSPLCLGSMNFGDVWKAQLGECNKGTTIRIPDQFYNSGGNFIDTANFYMLGESEQWLGEWMELRGIRDQVGGSSKKSLKISLEKSLQNLKTDYVDILYVHAWEGISSIPEIMRALDDVVRAGKVLYLGVSNWPAWIVVKANEYARQHGLSPFVVYERRWNVANKEIERDILPMCKAEGMGITVWSPMASGRFKLSGPDEAGRKWSASGSEASIEGCQKFAVVMDPIGKEKGTDAMGVALRYVMLKAPYVFPIVGGRKIEHLQRNIKALGIDLSEEEIHEIESAVPFDFGYPHSTISGDRYKPISGGDPCYFIRACCYFEGVEDPKDIHPAKIL